MSKLTTRIVNLAERSTRFGKEFTAGISREEVQRLFDQDAKGAYQALAEDAPAKQDLIQQIRGFFIGFALKLSPGRRVLFVVCYLVPVLSFFNLDATIGPYHLTIDFSPLWFLTSIAGLTLLLALELVDRLRFRDELDVARELQSDLLPHRAPDLAGYRLAHSYRTANEIGGDYYDFLELPDGRLVLTVGDASGHGISAGLVMAIANATLKTALDVDPAPEAVLRQLNRVLFRTGSKRAFMTLFYSILDPTTGELEFASAGHPPPLLRRAKGEIEELGEGSLPLGLNTLGHFPTGRATLEPGDLLVLYSDGIPEASAEANGETFGFERLKGLLSRPGSPQVIHDRIVKAVEAHLSGRSLADDLTLVVLDRAPELKLPARFP